MLSVETRKEIIALINREVVPATGCTEPVAVSLCTAKAVETLGFLPQSIEVRLSPNILKNAMGVGIPGTGMIGLPIAVALGAIVGRSEYNLEVLKDTTPEAVEQGRRMIDDGCINIALKEGACDMLYIEVTVSAGDDSATVVIAGAHTNFVYIEHNGVVLHDRRTPVGAVLSSDKSVELTFEKVWEFATASPIDELSFILF